MDTAALRQLEERIWGELAQSVRDREHGWRTPVLATVDAEGAPAARTVVLRDVTAPARALRFFTDVRSPKVGELQRQPQAVLVFWSEALQWQLRVRARFTVQREGPVVDEAWARIGASAAARDYLSPQAPGDRPHPAATQPVAGAAHHFCILTATVEAIDWLELRVQAPHRRVCFSQDGAAALVP